MKFFFVFLSLLLPLTAGLSPAVSSEWECNNEDVLFDHVPSQYYGSGQYFSRCPDTDVRIRCYHYHRHWICEKEAVYYWDRNLDSAARAACECVSPEGVKPSAPAVSKKPETRFHEAFSK